MTNVCGGGGKSMMMGGGGGGGVRACVCGQKDGGFETCLGHVTERAGDREVCVWRGPCSTLVEGREEYRHKGSTNQ